MTAAREIAAALGSTCQSGGWWRCRCPCTIRSGPTLASRDGDRSIVVKCHAGCSRADVLAELGQRGLLSGIATASGRPPDLNAIRRRREAEEQDRRRRIAGALDLWQCETCPAGGTIVETYLQVRGYIHPIPPTIRRSLGMLRHRESGERRPAMVALVEHADRGPVGVHLTYLATDGSRKATIEPAKHSLGPVGGGAVRLSPAGEVLLVAEGIETGLAAMLATGRPAWAALSTSGMKALILPPVVREIAILADHDTNGAGEDAARLAAERWLSEGRRVRIAMPPEPDTDFADVLAGRGITSRSGVSHAAG